jgi:FMN-dependent NADH-azoreductase
VIAVLTRGGIYRRGGPQRATDFELSYLREILGLIGLTDVTFLHADRQGIGGQAAQLATENALPHEASLFPPVTPEPPHKFNWKNHPKT